MVGPALSWKNGLSSVGLVGLPVQWHKAGEPALFFSLLWSFHWLRPGWEWVAGELQRELWFQRTSRGSPPHGYWKRSLLPIQPTEQ